MKKKAIILTVLLIAALSFIATGCIVEGSNLDAGEQSTRTYDFTDFTEIEIGDAFRLEVIPSDEYSITITAGENILDKLDVTKSGNRLKIDLDSWFFFFNNEMEATVTMPVLEGLFAGGASRTTAKGFTSSGDFRATVSGASSLDIEMETGDADIEISGASRVTGILTATGTDFEVSGASTLELEGTGGDARLSASGASRIKMEEFALQDAAVQMSGASSGTVNASGRLDVNLSGASSLRYTGDPDLGDIDTTGGSSFRAA